MELRKSYPWECDKWKLGSFYFVLSKEKQNLKDFYIVITGIGYNILRDSIIMACVKSWKLHFSFSYGMLTG